MNKYVKMVLTLSLTSSVASLILSCVYRATKVKIADTQKMLLKTSLTEVLDGDHYIPVIPDTLYKVLIKEDTVGIIFRIFPQGYSGKIPVLVGLNNDGSINAVRVAGPAEGLKETPGLGTKVSEPEFVHQFVGKKTEAIKLRNEGGVIDAVTGATISSRAVISGVRNGIEFYQKYLAKKDVRLDLFPQAQNFPRW